VTRWTAGPSCASWSDQDVRAFDAYLTRFGDDLEAFKSRLATPSSTPTSTTTSTTNGTTADPDSPSTLETTTEELAHER
jgi:hypothetical protein